MKNLLCICLLSLSLNSFAQTNEYKAANGVTYHLNDTVRLRKGSGGNGDFLFAEERGIPSPGHSRFLPKEFTSSKVILKRISKLKRMGITKNMFIVSAGGLFNYSLNIDDAILACEVVPCAPTAINQKGSVADELKKFEGIEIISLVRN